MSRTYDTLSLRVLDVENNILSIRKSQKTSKTITITIVFIIVSEHENVGTRYGNGRLTLITLPDSAAGGPALRL